jgi:hypothetical protein
VASQYWGAGVRNGRVVGVTPHYSPTRHGTTLPEAATLASLRHALQAAGGSDFGGDPMFADMTVTELIVRRPMVDAKVGPLRSSSKSRVETAGRLLRTLSRFSLIRTRRISWSSWPSAISATIAWRSISSGLLRNDGYDHYLLDVDLTGFKRGKSISDAFAIHFGIRRSRRPVRRFPDVARNGAGNPPGAVRICGWVCMSLCGLSASLKCMT